MSGRDGSRSADEEEEEEEVERRDEDEDASPWQLIPDSVLLGIFCLLDPRSLVAASSTCRLWYRVGCDELLWRDRVRADFGLAGDGDGEDGVAAAASLPPSSPASSWRLEYRRLSYCTPVVCTEQLREHEDQVLHVSFSHDGRHFATCSKDGRVLVWSATQYPAVVRHERDMRRFSWKLTQYSQFNEDDSLLLVSGVHCGSAATTGEVAVFALDDDAFTLQCRVNNSPYDGERSIVCVIFSTFPRPALQPQMRTWLFSRERPPACGVSTTVSLVLFLLSTAPRNREYSWGQELKERKPFLSAELQASLG